MNIEYYPAEQFHERRRQGIGGSDVAKIVGVSRYGSALQVYMDKKGLSEEVEPNQAMIMGTKLEPIIRELYAEKNDNLLFSRISPFHKLEIESNKILIHTKGDYYYFHADDLIYPHIVNFEMDIYPEPIGGFEAKTSRMMNQWGYEPDEIPEEYILQCQWGMFVCDLPFFDLAVLLQGNEYRQYRIVRDDTIIASLRKAVDSFWNDNVLKSIPPPPTDQKSDSELLNALYKETDQQAKVDEKVLEYITHLQTTKETLKHIEADKTKFENLIKEKMGDCSKLVTDTHKITWKAPKDTVRVDWCAVSGCLADFVSQDVYQTALSNNSTIRKNSRRFNFNEVKNGK